MAALALAGGGPAGAVAPETGAVGGAARASSVQEGPEGAFRQAEAAWQEGRVDDALQGFARLVEEWPATRVSDLPWRAAARVRAGEIELRRGRAGEASAHFVAVLDDEIASPWSSRARLGLATVQLWRGEVTAAAMLLQEVVTAAAAGAPAADEDAARRAAVILGLTYRLGVRPASGAMPWQRTTSLAIPGVTLDDPVGVAADADGRLLVVDEGLDRALLLDPDGVLSDYPVRDGRRPWFDEDGAGYVPAPAGVRVTPTAETVGFVVPGGGRAMEEIEAGVRSPAGEWLLLDRDVDTVWILGPGGEHRGSIDLGPDAEPLDLARDRAGRTYVLDERTRTVQRYDTSGVLGAVLDLDRWEEPHAIATDLMGNLYVLDRDARRIDVFSSDGAVRWSLGPQLPGGAEFRDPRDLAVDGRGRILVADRDLAAVLVID